MKILRVLGLLIMSIFFPVLTISQTIEYSYRTPQDSSKNCYLTVVPDGKINGMIVRDFSSLKPNASIKDFKYELQNLAAEAGFITLIATTSDYFPELFFDLEKAAVLDEIVNEVTVKYKVPQNRIFTCGISASGVRALRYTQYCNEGRSKFSTQIAGAIAVDSPIDLARFYHSVHRNKDKLKLGMKEEAEMMQRVFHEKIGGSPTESPDKYVKASVYSHLATDGGNVKHFMNTPILLICEPDMDWWINERGASYEDINAIDLTNFTRELRHQGHKDVTLVITTGRGYLKDGTRNCHSWTMVDEGMVMDWILKR